MNLPFYAIELHRLRLGQDQSRVVLGMQMIMPFYSAEWQVHLTHPISNLYQPTLS